MKRGRYNVPLIVFFLFTLVASPAILRTLRRCSWVIPACGLRVTGYLRELIEESRRQHRVGH